MFTRVKTTAEIAAMRESGAILAAVLKKVEQTVGPGMTGKDVSALCRQELQGFGAQASFLDYQGFPDVICISPNDAVVHGIPNEQPFKQGDIIGFDFGVTYKGMITDSALSLCIGPPSSQQKTLLQQTERAMYAGIEQVKNGVRTGDIGAAIEKILDAAKLGIVRDLVGHGVGHSVHEDPNIPNYGPAGKGPTLRVGMTIAIEPMATLGGDGVVVARDGWTILTADHTLAAHFEHTVLITQDGYDVLTERS